MRFQTSGQQVGSKFSTSNQPLATTVVAASHPPSAAASFEQVSVSHLLHEVTAHMPSRCCSRCVKSTSPAAKKDKSNITPSVPDQTSARFPFLLFPDLLPATPLVADPSPVTRCGPCAVAPSTATWRMKRPLVQFRPGNARRLHLPKRPICLGFFIASLFHPPCLPGKFDRQFGSLRVGQAAVLHVALGDIFHHKQRAVAVHTGTGLVYFIYLI